MFNVHNLKSYAIKNPDIDPENTIVSKITEIDEFMAGEISDGLSMRNHMNTRLMSMNSI